MLHKIRVLSFIPQKRPLLQFLSVAASLSDCFFDAWRRFKRAAPDAFYHQPLDAVAEAGDEEKVLVITADGKGIVMHPGG